MTTIIRNMIPRRCGDILRAMRFSRPGLVRSVCIGLAILLIAAFLVTRQSMADRAVQDFKESIARDTSFQGQWAAYTNLLSAVGPGLAQDTLAATMPANPRSHMLNHESGKYLYAKEGIAGIYDCKNDFNGSCFHGFISDFLSDRGLGALDQIIQLCRAGRPLDQARECSHGVGHAFLILAGYAHLPDAVKKCRTEFATSTDGIGDCDDGVFMENNFGEFSTPPADRWYKASDPLYPCDAPGISGDTVAHNSCWFMQSQATLNANMYPQFRGDVKSVSTYCATLSDLADKRTCVEGLARQIQAQAGSDTGTIESVCRDAFTADPQQCYSDAAESAYAFGAESTGVQLCASSGTHTSECYQALFDRISSTAYRTLPDRLAACGRIPDASVAATCTAYIRAHTDTSK